MYKELVPMLSKGTFALYYGGPKIVDELNDKPSSITRLDNTFRHNFNELFMIKFSPIFVLCSGIFQLLFILFKWRKTKKVDPGTLVIFITRSSVLIRHLLQSLLFAS